MLIDRLDKLKQQIDLEVVDAIIITDVFLISYLTGFTNFSNEEREVWLVITLKEQYILTDGRYTTAVKNQVKYFELLEISVKNSLENILRDLSKKHQLKTIGIDFANITHIEYKYFRKIFPKIKPVKLHQLRSIKEIEEIEKIKQACLLGDEAFKNVLTKIRVGVTEQDLSLEIELFVRKNQAKLSFETIVAFGENSAVPHHQTGDKKLDKRAGQFVLFDLGTKVNGYCSDMTRTAFFGKPSTEQIKIYNTVKMAQAKAVDFIQEQLNKGKKIKSKVVDQVARGYIISHGYQSIPHSLGHGTGLQVHEAPSLSPKSKDCLEAGMVFSIEPGIYLPGFGGVRIEDLYIVNEGKITQLTASPKNLIVIT